MALLSAFTGRQGSGWRPGALAIVFTWSKTWVRRNGRRELPSHSQGLHQPHRVGYSYSLTLLGDFNFIYKQDKSPSSINLGKQRLKTKNKNNMEGQDKELMSIQKRRRRKEEEPVFHPVPNVLLCLCGPEALPSRSPAGGQTAEGRPE